MKRIIVKGLPIIAFLVLAGCVAPQTEYNKRIAVGAYGEANKIATKEANKNNGDQLLWRLQAGSAASYSGNMAESIRQFDLAEDIFQKNDQKSVFDKGSAAVGGLLLNDLVFDYNGMGLDRTFCCLYKAIDFAAQGKMSPARTELNRAAQHQENWVYERKKDVEAAYNKLNKEGEKAAKEKNIDSIYSSQKVESIASDRRVVELIKDKTGVDYNEYGNLERLSALNYTSIYLAHLCGVFRWLNKDGGRNFLKDAATLAAGNQLLAEDFRNADAGRAPGNNVWVYVEDGLCSYRQPVTVIIPTHLLALGGLFVMPSAMSLPVLRERPPAAERYYVETSSGGSNQMLFLENIDRLVRTEYGIFMRGAVPREIARVLIRVGSQVALAVAANNTRDSNARVGLYLTQIGIGIFGIAVSEADTRSWQALPKNIYVHKVPCPADGKVRIKAGNMPTIEVDVPRDCPSIIWVRRPTAFAVPGTKVISFK
ncbi:MAG: hypothetical protein IJS08_01580 [Victivallales bacterium]|nr:hypothetical protein [Victivallales bacterium]